MMDLLADSQLENSLFNRAPFTGLRKANEIAQKFYQYGDDFWKIMGFENEKALLIKHKGMTEAEAEVEAAERIRNTYPTYSMTGRFVQRLRRFPLAGTFVSFPAEIIRTSYHILRYVKLDLQQTPALGYRKVAGLAIASGMIHALQTVASCASQSFAKPLLTGSSEEAPSPPSYGPTSPQGSTTSLSSARGRGPHRGSGRSRKIPSRHEGRSCQIKVGWIDICVFNVSWC
jgi:hypothetical protein